MGKDKKGLHGPTVRALRERLGVSQERLGQRAGLTMQTINRIENGRVSISHSLTIKAIAEALDVDPRLIMKA